MCLRFVSSPSLFDGCPSQLCLSRWSGSSRRARFRRPVSGVLACVSAIKTWETVSSANPPVCITIQKLSFTPCLTSSGKWKKKKNSNWVSWPMVCAQVALPYAASRCSPVRWPTRWERFPACLCWTASAAYRRPLWPWGRRSGSAMAFR